MNEYKEWGKQNSICINCYKEKAWNNRLMCADCLAEAQERSERTRSELSKEQRRMYVKRKRELCIALGVCRECLKREAKVRLKCVECHVKQVKRNEAKRKTVVRHLRVELGLCYFCGAKAIEGKKTCPKCYEIQSEKLKKWHREDGDNSNHYWRTIQRGEVKAIQHWKRIKDISN